MTHLLSHLRDAARAEWVQSLRELAEELRERSGPPVQLWDERLSSVVTHEILDEAGMTEGSQICNRSGRGGDHSARMDGVQRTSGGASSSYR
jgi:RNase H-fold protein (predicted Holliday junction resolvase)